MGSCFGHATLEEIIACLSDLLGDLNDEECFIALGGDKLAAAFLIENLE